MRIKREKVENTSFMVKGRTALIDLDSLLYKVGFMAQRDTLVIAEEGYEEQYFSTMTEAKAYAKTIDFPVENIEKRSEVEKAITVKKMIRKTIRSWARKSKCEYYALFLHGGGNFREDLIQHVDYKGNRVNLTKPLLFDKIKQFIIKEYKVNMVEGIETDDMVCIKHWQAFKKCKDIREDMGTVLVSIDKDLMQIPGWYLNPDKFDKPRWIKPEGFLKLKRRPKKPSKLTGGGEVWFYAQMLLGDTADNIKGIKGMGPVGVHDLLKPLIGDPEALERAVWEYYKKQHGEDAWSWFVETGVMLWMLRDESESRNTWLPTFVRKEDA